MICFVSMAPWPRLSTPPIGLLGGPARRASQPAVSPRGPWHEHSQTSGVFSVPAIQVPVSPGMRVGPPARPRSGTRVPRSSQPACMPPQGDVAPIDTQSV